MSISTLPFTNNALRMAASAAYEIAMPCLESMPQGTDAEAHHIRRSVIPALEAGLGGFGPEAIQVTPKHLGAVLSGFQDAERQLDGPRGAVTKKTARQIRNNVLHMSKGLTGGDNPEIAQLRRLAGR